MILQIVLQFGLMLFFEVTYFYFTYVTWKIMAKPMKIAPDRNKLSILTIYQNYEINM